MLCPIHGVQALKECAALTHTSTAYAHTYRYGDRIFGAFGRCLTDLGNFSPYTTPRAPCGILYLVGCGHAYLMLNAAKAI